MAEPWSHDFDALAADSRAGLRSLDATRAILTERARTPRPKEIKMRYFKNHPALAALVVFLALGLVSGAAYAVVHEVWVSIDSSKSAAEIQQDVQSQLAAQGMNGTVTAQKTDDGRLKVMIRSIGSDDSDVPDVHVQVDGSDQDHAASGRSSVRIAVTCQLDDAQSRQLSAVTGSAAFQALLAPDDADDGDGAGSAGSDADRAAAISQLLAAQGFHAVQVQVAGGDISVTITAPPTP